MSRRDAQEAHLEGYRKGVEASAKLVEGLAAQLIKDAAGREDLDARESRRAGRYLSNVVNAIRALPETHGGPE